MLSPDVLATEDMPNDLRDLDKPDGDLLEIRSIRSVRLYNPLSPTRPSGGASTRAVAKHQQVAARLVKQQAGMTSQLYPELTRIKPVKKEQSRQK